MWIDIIIFDEVDDLWRCCECQWGIEADNEIDSDCHCLKEERQMQIIDLSQIPEH